MSLYLLIMLKLIALLSSLLLLVLSSMMIIKVDLFDMSFDSSNVVNYLFIIAGRIGGVSVGKYDSNNFLRCWSTDYGLIGSDHVFSELDDHVGFWRHEQGQNRSRFWRERDLRASDQGIEIKELERTAN